MRPSDKRAKNIPTKPEARTQSAHLEVAPLGAEPKSLFVTQPSLPPLEEFLPFLEKIWQSKVLTNGGPFHQEFERALCDFLGVKHIAVFNNGTVALLTAIQALKITGEVITTPYSFVATAHALLWNKVQPVFVDVDPRTLNLDPDKIEAAITANTTAILPVHCYGHPCDVDRIEKIAKRHNLKLIYDAAHAFGVHCHCGSVLNHGDLSVLSFHATKVFNTFEGGAIVCHDADTKRLIDQLKNFGFTDEVTVNLPGINGKLSEFNAALGLLQLRGHKDAVRKRKAIADYYCQRLANAKGIHCLPDSGEAEANFGYFPILVMPEYPLARDELYKKFRGASIYVRRYFYPLISDHPMYRSLPSAVHENLPNARAAASRVVCLPMSSNLTKDDAERVVSIIIDGGDTA